MKKYSKKINLALALVLCLTMILTGCGQKTEAPAAGTTSSETAAADAGKVFVLKAGHVLQTDHPYHLGLLKMAEIAKEKSGGRIEIQVFPASQLGNERDLIEGLQLGSVDISLTATAPVSNFSPELLVFDLPYLFKDKAHAYKALDGEIGKSLFAKLEDDGLIGLEFFESGFFVLHTNQEGIKTPDDVKGMKIRTMENVAHMGFFTALDASATPMAFGEVYTALQNKTIDGAINSLAVIYSNKFFIPAPYFTMTNQVYAPSPVMISKKTYDSLPTDLQQIIREAAAEARDFERQQNTEMEKTIIEKMKAEGCTFYDVDQAEWSAAVVDKIYGELVPSKIDPEMVKKIQELK